MVGADASNGEWMLFTDADVHFENGCIERALNFALCEGVDHLVVAPELRTRGFFEKVFVSFFVVILLTWLRGWRVNDPASYTGKPGATRMSHGCFFQRSL